MVNACGGYAGTTGALVSAAGTLQQQVVTGSQYCDFALTDEATGQLYALRESGVDLSALVGQRVTVAGTLVPATRIARSRRRLPWCVYLDLPAMATTCSASVPQLRYSTQLCRTVLVHPFRSSSGSSR